MSAEGIIASYPATVTAVASARRDVLQFAARQEDVPAETLDGIALVVSEAVSNVVRHAYTDGGTVWVEVQADSEELRLIVSDNGCGMTDAPGALGVGLGIRYMRAFCDGMTIAAPAAGGVTVRTRFLLL